MMNPLDLIDFGTDISNVRSEIDENIKLLKLKKTYAGLYKKLKSSNSKYVKENAIFQKPPKEAIAFLGFFSHIFFIPILESIKATPYKIHPYFIMATEALYYLSNQDKLLSILDTPDKRLSNYYRKLFIEYGRLTNSIQDKALEILMNDGDLEEDLKSMEKQFDANENNFIFLFAATLRQMPVIEIDNFLFAQKAAFPAYRNFNDFVELSILDYKKLIPKKTRKVVKNWLKVNQSNSLSLSKDFSNKINSEISSHEQEIIFEKLPKDWVSIPGKLKSFQIIDFLSFLKDETNGCLSGLPFITDEEFEVLKKYGLAYPLKEPKEKCINFQRTNRKTYGILYHMIFKLFEKNKPIDASADYKMHYAKFIKYRIGGINASLQSILDNMDNEKPAKLAQAIVNKYVAKLNSRIPAANN